MSETVLSPVAAQRRYTDAENLARRVLARMDSLTAKLRDLEADIRQLWVEFDKLQPGETILGCATKKEFCEKKLHRTPRALQYLLYGRTEPSEHCSPLADARQMKRLAEGISNGLQKVNWVQDIPEIYETCGAVSRLTEVVQQEIDERIRAASQETQSSEQLTLLGKVKVGDFVLVRRGNDQVKEKVVSVTGGRCDRRKYPIVVTNKVFDKNHFTLAGECYSHGRDSYDAQVIEVLPKSEEQSEPSAPHEEPESAPKPESTESNRQLRREAFVAEHPEYEGKFNKEIEEAIRRANAQAIEQSAPQPTDHGSTPKPPLQNSRSEVIEETFFVIRRQSDGWFFSAMRRPWFHEQLAQARQFDEKEKDVSPEACLHSGGISKREIASKNFASKDSTGGSSLEWVKVDATFRLTPQVNS